MAHSVTKILVLSGPNLNLLGTREPERYGRVTLDEIHDLLGRFAESCEVALETFQSNAEHELVERIHAAGRDGVDWIVFNPAAFTHTSIALRDALLGVGIPFVEVHLTNIAAREPFRRHSYFSDIAKGRIAGFGADSYLLALQAVINQLNDITPDHGS